MSKTCICEVQNEDLLQENVFKFVVQVKWLYKGQS